MTFTNYYQPALVNLPSGKFVVCNEGWIPVPESYTYDDVRKNWKKVVLKSQIKDKVIRVKSNSSNQTYQITIERGNYHCTCPGFSFRRKCKHVDQIKNIS